MMIDRSYAGQPGEPMMCDAATRAARETGMIKLAQRPGYVGHAVRRKLKGDFTLQGVSRAFATSERCAWNLMLAVVPMSTLERRNLEDAAGLEPGTLDKWLD